MNVKSLVMAFTLLVAISANAITWTHFESMNRGNPSTVFYVDMGRTLTPLETVEILGYYPTLFVVNMWAAPLNKDKTAFCIRLFLGEIPVENISFRIIALEKEQEVDPSSEIFDTGVIAFDDACVYKSASGTYLTRLNFTKHLTDQDTLSVMIGPTGSAVVPHEIMYCGLDIAYVMSTNDLRRVRFSVTGPGDNAVTNPPIVITGSTPRLKAIFRSAERTAYRLTASTNPIAVTIGSGKRKQSFLVPESEIHRMKGDVVVVLDKSFITGPVRFGLATSTTTNVMICSERPATETFASGYGRLTFTKGSGNDVKGVMFEPSPVHGAYVPMKNIFVSDTGFYGVLDRRNCIIVGLYTGR